MRTARARTAAGLLLAAGAASLACSAGAQAVGRAPAAVRPPEATSLPPAPPPGRWSFAQLQEAFTLADTDTDQQLTRLEAQQLAIVPRSFEEMDQNKDGVLSRAEYEGRRG